MTVEFKLPDLGEGIHEAEIIAVKVEEIAPGGDGSGWGLRLRSHRGTALSYAV